ncbi:MAG: hypothetical protein ACRDOH_27220 [Streptosporangiaceae bacterium]
MAGAGPIGMLAALFGVQRGYQVHVFDRVTAGPKPGLAAARGHYEQAVEALARADPAWLGALISRRVPLSSWPQALTRQPGDVKVTMDLTRDVKVTVDLTR